MRLRSSNVVSCIFGEGCPPIYPSKSYDWKILPLSIFFEERLRLTDFVRDSQHVEAERDSDGRVSIMAALLAPMWYGVPTYLGRWLDALAVGEGHISEPTKCTLKLPSPGI
jgi:hypothetical protein